MNDTFYFDGWYMTRQDAEYVANNLRAKVGVVAALVVDKGGDGGFGILYISTREHYPNHRADEWTDLGREGRPGL